jgi:pimeloyl-ACP methyl ester carboxylesterase
VFSKLSTLLHTIGVRVVSIQRRNYAGSTPLTAAELAIAEGGTDEEKAALDDHLDRELVELVNWFIERHDLSPITSDGFGGVALLGWSMGAAYALGFAAVLKNAPAALQERISQYLRGIFVLGQLGCAQAPSY